MGCFKHYIMKTGILILFIIFSFPAFSQDKSVEQAVQKFLTQFNDSNYNSIYESFSPEYKEKVSKKALTMYLSKIHKIIKSFKSAQFVSTGGSVSQYFFICKNEKVNADFQCSLDDDGRFDFLSFKRIGGTGNPPTVGKIIHE